MQQENKKINKSDFQTASIFVILALLTGVFVLGLRWALLAPTPRQGAIVIEQATK